MRQVARLADKQLVLALVVALLGFGGQILAYTYVTPFPGGRQRLQPSTISLLLLGFGAAAAVGNFIAGPIADRWLGPALLGGLALLAAIGSDLDAGLIPITVPELLRLLRDTVIPPAPARPAPPAALVHLAAPPPAPCPPSPPALECLR